MCLTPVVLHICYTSVIQQLLSLSPSLAHVSFCIFTLIFSRPPPPLSYNYSVFLPITLCQLVHIQTVSSSTQMMQSLCFTTSLPLSLSLQVWVCCVCMEDNTCSRAGTHGKDARSPHRTVQSPSAPADQHLRLKWCLLFYEALFVTSLC